MFVGCGCCGDDVMGVDIGVAVPVARLSLKPCGGSKSTE